VAAYVFARGEEIAGGVEECCAVDSSGLVEEALRFAEAIWEAVKDFGFDLKDVFSAGWADCLERKQRGFATDAAAGGGVEVALEVGEADEYVGCEFYADDISTWLIRKCALRRDRGGDFSDAIGGVCDLVDVV